MKLQTTVVVETVDYHGHPRNVGGDLIGTELTLADNIQENQNAPIETEVTDLENGIYEIHFRPPTANRYVLKISVFERPIKDYPLFFDATEHNEPIEVYGRRGNGKDEFHQPVSVAVDDEGTIYILDTGNSRIKVRLTNYFTHRLLDNKFSIFLFFFLQLVMIFSFICKIKHV